MTFERALKELKRQVKCWKNGIPFAYKMQPLEVAVSALEKQVPMKPINREGTTYFCCPVCGGNHTYQYCGDCGQALDWSDNE